MPLPLSFSVVDAVTVTDARYRFRCSQAPAKVVDEVRANLQAQQDQLKTVQQCIADLDL